MNKEEKDFFERCVGIVAGLEVENEAQAIAKEVVLSEVEDLQNRIDKATQYIKNDWYKKDTRDIENMISLGDWRLDLLEILKGENNE